MYIYRSGSYKGKAALLLLPLRKMPINPVNTRVYAVTKAIVTFSNIMLQNNVLVTFGGIYG